MGNHLIAPSILAADFGNLKADIEMVKSGPNVSVTAPCHRIYI